MRIPYSCVTTHGGVVFAARGGQIQTFKLDGGPALTTWNHPDAEREAAASVEAAVKSAEKGGETAGAEDAAMEDEPPSKRQRVEQVAPEESTPEAGTATPQDTDAGEKAKAKYKDKKGPSRGPWSRSPDYHLIFILEVSADGKHVVAVSGNDKTIWVFEHDGNGALKEASKR
ncbi:hypothetical protein IMZ48_44735 [Candidatus Bathyarchaeota archaeon]|nr:hypothetical protein [Candidatus Bathyarchaeota archaeon]